ncbi:MAG: hypothetical protein JWN73_4252 [Betaproteobacteria bacterium]|nr:hypothetical protein [Betaproteobacteria bacterium]
MEEQCDVLNHRQQRFVFEYLKDLNASAAAERAGYSARSRGSQAGELMQNPAVRERIRLEMHSMLAELRLSAIDLMKERMRAAFFRAGQLFDPSGQLRGFEEMEASVRDSLVISGKWRNGEREVSFRAPNREPALRALERVHERLEKLDEQHYEKIERQLGVYMPGGVGWVPLPPVQPLPQLAPEPARVGEPAVVRQPQTSAENLQGFSGSAEPAAHSSEKSQGFSGSAPKEAKPSMLAKALAVLTSGKEDAEAAQPEWQAPPPIKRRDPNLLWGGARQCAPPGF